MIMARTAPQIRPHTPYFTFAAVTGVIDHPSRAQKVAGHVVAEERGTRVVGHPALRGMLCGYSPHPAHASGTADPRARPAQEDSGAIVTRDDYRTGRRPPASAACFPAGSAAPRSVAATGRRPCGLPHGRGRAR